MKYRRDLQPFGLLNKEIKVGTSHRLKYIKSNSRILKEKNVSQGQKNIIDRKISRQVD